jgi:fructose-bisphosphate aldolase class I
VPPSVPGITFLSGGLSEEEASIYLNTMNLIKRKVTSFFPPIVTL